jgi:glucan biosynthesis protein
VVPEVGVEIDRVAVAPAGVTVWFEYKGSVQGARPGLMRTDTLKKAIANGALLERLVDHPPYVVLTSHLPTNGSGLAMLQSAIELRYFDDVVCVYDPAQTVRLRGL